MKMKVDKEQLVNVLRPAPTTFANGPCQVRCFSFDQALSLLLFVDCQMFKTSAKISQNDMSRNESIIFM